MLKQLECGDELPVGVEEAVEELLTVFLGVEEAARDAGDFRRSSGPVTLILDESVIEAAVEVRRILDAAREARELAAVHGDTPDRVM